MNVLHLKSSGIIPDSPAQVDLIVPSEQLSTEAGLDESILARGWCPHQVEVLRELYDSPGFAYLTAMNKNGFRTANHRQCSYSTRCIANNVDMSDYTTRHTTDNCSCGFIAVDYEEITNIIRNGGVPMIAVHSIDASDIVSLSIEARTAKSRYTAISHVWFDGLGNPAENALPVCQLKRLQSNLARLPESKESSLLHLGAASVDWRRLNFSTSSTSKTKLFWMDTLCIPVQNQDANLRIQAINQMASIYAAAVQVLVLDAELEKCFTSTSSACEIIARILSSAWMSRSWTFQEGVLGRECVFQFADAAVNPIHEWDVNGSRVGSKTAATFPEIHDEDNQRLYKTFYDSLWSRTLQTWKSSLSKDESNIIRLGDLIGNREPARTRGTFQNIPIVDKQSSRQAAQDARHFQMMTSDKHRVEQLVVTWNELSGRSTTMSKDIHVIVANLLDFNADAVMRLEEDERMGQMVFSFNTLPVSLFFNTGPRFNQSGHHRNRWLPIEPSKIHLCAQPTMTLAADYLTWIREDDNTHFHIWIIPGPTLDAGTYVIRSLENVISDIVEVLTPIEDQFNPTAYQALCILIDNRPENQTEERGALFYVTGKQLAITLNEAPEELQLVYHSPVRIRSSTPNFEIIQTLGGVRVPSNCKVLVEYGERKAVHILIDPPLTPSRPSP